MGKSKWVGQSYVFKHLLLNSYSAPRKWSPNFISQNVHGYQIKDLTMKLKENLILMGLLLPLLLLLG